jgi:hypothetical protein
MTDISVSTTNHQVEDRSWLLSQWGQGPGENPSITLDVSAFIQGTHYPNGYIKSGEPLGKITATGLYGPYDNAAADGREVCAGFLHSATKIPNLLDLTKDVGAALVAAGFVKESRLPRTVDATGQTDLKLVHFSA